MSPTLSSISSGKVARSFLVSLLVIVGATATRADIAILREKGPKSGAVFSNPGVVDKPAAHVYAAMRRADVKIRLKPAEGKRLAAECVAEFELADLSPPSSESNTFLVAFPATGLSSGVVTVDHFQVTVDGTQPPTILRRSIAVSRKDWKLQDTPVAGQLDARFAKPRDWGVALRNEIRYRDAFVWEQTLRKGGTSNVRVTYTVFLKPQSIHYSKSFDSAEDDHEVIPFHDLAIDRWQDQYFFFDYVLYSGATWDGPIGLETISISADPSLNLDLRHIQSFHRRSVGNQRRGNNDGLRGNEAWIKIADGVGTIELRNETPTYDVLLAIPVSAVSLK